MRRILTVVAAAALLPLTMAACGDDDTDDNGNIEVPDIDPGEGSGLPG